MINKDNQVVKMVAMLARILTPIKPPVCLAFKVNIRTKTINPVANHAVLENTMINKDKPPNLVVNHAVLANTTISKDNPVVKMVAMAPTLTPTKPLV